ncbi:HAD family hydrolase [Pseudonocardia abyssalis]|uniref:HAD-IA family hydrolase n=1 Tax=Pseudonocardia abyssalis TaxID=2792008 RepID=A0ABS6UNX0_9PSEU|nr:HAD-IA family hydrolase [Pseudonocardia abyssalis]MBW0117126.1 HAD-IA family hydrolase [Pseudonocardia abyssalis]MBW0133951.1 HAD-IA family hydrolase [Pseudonocardia abyssalis]
MSAVLFGSIGTLAETSEIQREAFNDAFRAHGLDWHWERADYLAMLKESGGRDRIARYAEARGTEVDADAVHRSKSQAFRRLLATSGLTARPGVVDTITAARAAGMKVGLVTTTSRGNIDSLLDALGPDVAGFDVVVDASEVSSPKPDAAAYTHALETLGEQAGDCVAIEDNGDGVTAASAAGVPCIAFPGANTAGHGFSDARSVVDHLDPADLLPRR